MTPQISWSDFDPSLVDPAVTHIVRTTFLLESRSELYGSYLATALPPHLASCARGWAAEEAHHGRALGRWLDLADPTFDQGAALLRYSELPYHPGGNRRGGPTAELIARCVVEALATAFYQALADWTTEPLLQQICRRLSADEQRHFDMFHSWLLQMPDRPTRLRTARMALRRLVELEDDQIAFAAHIADGATTYERRHSRRQHLRRVYRMHQVDHVHTAVTLVDKLIDSGAPTPIQRLIAHSGRALLRARALTI